MMKSPLNTSIEETQKNATKRRVSGEFVRGVSGFRHAIGDPDFQPETNRYHLFVAFNCPWCHRVSLARNILGLQSSITIQKQMTVLDLTYGNLHLNVLQSPLVRHYLNAH
jgi:glutathionyl-hydroquinone reductase